MSNIDISKIKAGEEVVVKLRVVRTHYNDQWPVVVSLDTGSRSLSVTPEGREAYVCIKAITSHIARAFEPGDKVRLTDMPHEYAGEVLGIHEGLAWVRYMSGGYTTSPIANLERIND